MKWGQEGWTAALFRSCANKPHDRPPEIVIMTAPVWISSRLGGQDPAEADYPKSQEGSLTVRSYGLASSFRSLRKPIQPCVALLANLLDDVHLAEAICDPLGEPPVNAKQFGHVSRVERQWEAGRDERGQIPARAKAMNTVGLCQFLIFHLKIVRSAPTSSPVPRESPFFDVH